MKNMYNDELRKEREKEALRKREAYIKNKNSDGRKIVEKKNYREKCRNWKKQKMNCDELKKERKKEAIRKREAYINKNIAMIVKQSKRN